MVTDLEMEGPHDKEREGPRKTENGPQLIISKETELSVLQL